jgi:ribosome-associated protein
MERHIRSQVQEAAEAALSRNATDLVALDVSGRLALTDAFLIVSGSSERNVGGIADAVDERLGAAGIDLKRREGRGSGHWELLDFGDLVVHVFLEEDRAYYGLERLWRDCPVIPIEQPATAS